MAAPRFDLSRGACRGVDPELFFPLKGDSPATEAKAYCNGGGDRPACPVRQDCLSWAMASGEENGVFGGLTASERRHRRRTGPQGPGMWRDCGNPECGIEFLSSQPTARYCSTACRHRADYLATLDREQVAA